MMIIIHHHVDCGDDNLLRLMDVTVIMKKKRERVWKGKDMLKLTTNSQYVRMCLLVSMVL